MFPACNIRVTQSVKLDHISLGHNDISHDMLWHRALHYTLECLTLHTDTSPFRPDHAYSGCAINKCSLRGIRISALNQTSWEANLWFLLWRRRSSLVSPNLSFCSAMPWRSQSLSTARRDESADVNTHISRLFSIWIYIAEQYYQIWYLNQYYPGSVSVQRTGMLLVFLLPLLISSNLLYHYYSGHLNCLVATES